MGDDGDGDGETGGERKLKTKSAEGPGIVSGPWVIARQSISVEVAGCPRQLVGGNAIGRGIRGNVVDKKKEKKKRAKLRRHASEWKLRYQLLPTVTLDIPTACGSLKGTASWTRHAKLRPCPNTCPSATFSTRSWSSPTRRESSKCFTRVEGKYCIRGTILPTPGSDTLTHVCRGRLAALASAATCSKSRSLAAMTTTMTMATT